MTYAFGTIGPKESVQDMSSGRARRVSLGAVAVMVAVLAGCSGEADAPDPQPSDTRDSTPVVTPSTEPDEPPALAQVEWSTDGYLQAVGVYDGVVVTVADGEKYP